MGIIKHIPNAITSMNLLSGCFSVIFAINGDYKVALLFIIAAAIFDFCDGFAARLLRAYSPMGKELDSLADMVSFGVAPAMMLFSFMQSTTVGLITFVPLFIAVFSGLRLAKFNIDTRQTENFIGLATPACALFCGSLMYALTVYACIADFLTEYFYIIPLLSIILSYLLTSEIPMFSFKFKNITWKDNSTRFIFLGVVAILGCITIMAGLDWSIWVLLIFTCYIIINVTALPFSKHKTI
ncbi:MAG: CDP-diacylglycerol--serine O-phosphatidyltransferase [Bacteroidales bacterium]